MLRSFHYHAEKGIQTDLPLESFPELIKDNQNIIWVDMVEPTQKEIKTVLAETFQFHPLAIEDCQTPAERPKAESYGSYLFVILPAEGLRFVDDEPDVTEIACFLGDNFLVTYHRRKLACFDVMAQRCQANPHHQMARGPAFIMHGIIDTLVDSYFPHIAKVDNELDDLEQEIFQRPSEEILNKLLDARWRIQTLRRVLSPQRD
ncbi:MAG TPA: magnesium transporter CorA family protein, partial [bacterium]|nr:magnesium transporter CorA family protein [bacterium]